MNTDTAQARPRTQVRYLAPANLLLPLHLHDLLNPAAVSARPPGVGRRLCSLALRRAGMAKPGMTESLVIGTPMDTSVK